MHKKRQVNFELLRILCMYMIVIGHCLFHGRVTAKLGYGTVNYFLSYLIQSFSVVHVNCFVMIGGYFAIDRTFRSGRAVKLWRQVAFYSIGIFFLAAFSGKAGWADAVKAVCFGLYGNDAPDAFCRNSSNTDQQTAISVPVGAADTVFKRQSYDFSDRYLWNLQWTGSPGIFVPGIAGGICEASYEAGSERCTPGSSLLCGMFASGAGERLCVCGTSSGRYGIFFEL